MAKDSHEPISSSNFVPASVSSEGGPAASNSPREDVPEVLPGIARSIAAFLICRSESRQDFRQAALNAETLGEFRYW